MKSSRLLLLVFTITILSCSKPEYRKHGCFPSCMEIKMEGQIIDTINNQIAEVPFDVLFVHNPASWINLIPIKDKIICSSISDKSGGIHETFQCDRSKLKEDYSVYVSFKNDVSGHGFYIDSIPEEQPVKFVYYKH